MAFTRHGHQIPGTPQLRKRLFQTQNCGGLVACEQCVRDYKRSFWLNDPENDIFVTNPD